MNNNDRQRPLERLNIPAETDFPDHIISPAKAKSARFHLGSPGYRYDDVNDYKEKMDAMVDEIVNILHQRDLEIHLLDEELSLAETDKIKLKQQNEVLMSQKDIQQVNTDDNEIAALLEANQNLLQEKQELINKLNEMETWASEAEEYVASIEEENRVLKNGNTTTVPPAQMPGLNIEGS